MMIVDRIIAAILIIAVMVIIVMLIIMVRISMRSLVRHRLPMVSALMFFNNQFRPISKQRESHDRQHKKIPNDMSIPDPGYPSKGGGNWF